MALTRAEIVAALARRKDETEEVDVPELGGSLTIRRIGTDELRKLGYFDVVKPDFMSKLVEASVVGLEKKDAESLGASDFKVVERIFAAAAKFNGLTEEAATEAAETFGEAQPGESSSS